MPLHDDDEICFCFHVSLRKIETFCAVEKPRVPSQISECLSAGTGFQLKYNAASGTTGDSEGLLPQSSTKAWSFAASRRSLTRRDNVVGHTSPHRVKPK